MSNALAVPNPSTKSAFTPASALSVISALMPLSAVPLGLLLFHGTGQTDELRSPLAQLADRFDQGGPVTYPLVALATLAALVGSVGALLARKGRFRVWASSVFLAMTIPLVGAISFTLQAETTLKAAAWADPTDRGFLLRGGLAENNQLLILVAALVAALFCTQGLALILGQFSQKEVTSRRVLLALGVGLVAVGAWQAFSARALSGESAAMYASAHAIAIDRLTLITEGFGTMASNRRLSVIALIIAVSVAAGAAVLLRRERRKAATVLLGILVPVLVLKSTRAAAELDELGTEVMAAPALPREVLVLEAPAVDLYSRKLLFVGDELVNAYGEAPDFSYFSSTDVGLGLEPSVTTQSLMKALSQLSAASVRTVTLFGTKQAAVPDSAPEIHAHLFNEPRGLTLELARASDCGAGCQPATLDDRGLTWEDQTWPLKTASQWEIFVDKSIPLSAEGLTMQSLLNACHTVVGQGGKIVLLFPD